MDAVMISLVGEQPIPNLLPVKLDNPTIVALIHTERTQPISQRLKKLIPQAQLVGPVDPYDVAAIEGIISNWITTLEVKAAITYNLTGGTKTMMLAAYRVAEQHTSPLLYFQTEGRQSLVYRYHFLLDRKLALQERVEIPGILTIHDYLNAYLDSFQVTGYSRDAGGTFEQAIHQALDGSVDEVVAGVKVGGALDIDLVLRRGNRVGVVEAKTGKKAREKGGIDQLNTAASPVYLGTYTSKFLVIDQRWDNSCANLCELAEARGITVIELPSYAQHGALSSEDQQTLVQQIVSRL